MASDATLKQLVRAARARNTREDVPRLSYLIFVHRVLTQVHSDLRREADSHRFPVFLFDFALLRTYVQCRHPRSSAFRALDVLFRPGIEAALPPGAWLELLKYLLTLADELGVGFKAEIAVLIKNLGLESLIGRLPDERRVAPEARKLKTTDDVLDQISEAIRSAQEAEGRERAVSVTGELHRDAWEKADAILRILERRVTPLRQIAGEHFEIDPRVYGRALYALASQKRRQHKEYNNRADALNLAVAHYFASRKTPQQVRDGATPYFLLVTPDKAVLSAFSKINAQSVGGPIVRPLIYAFFRQLIASSPEAAMHPEETAWELRLAVEAELRSLGVGNLSGTSYRWYHAATPALIKAAANIWGLASKVGLGDDLGRPATRGEPSSTLLDDFTRELEAHAPTPSAALLLDTLVREPRPVKWLANGKPTVLVMKVEGEIIAECQVAQFYVSVWLESTAGFARFLDSVNHIWHNSRRFRRKIDKMFDGVDVVTGSGLIELAPDKLAPPWTADAIWEATDGAVPHIVRINTDRFDAWYEIHRHNGRLGARCGVITHLDLYLQMSDLLRDCAGKPFSPGECASSLEAAVGGARRKASFADKRLEGPSV